MPTHPLIFHIKYVFWRCRLISIHFAIERHMSKNIHPQTVKGFGDEWRRFDQSQLSCDEKETLFQRYFSIFPWQDLPKEAVGFDMGCGSGRWATLVAPRVGQLYCIDPSEALAVAQKNLAFSTNCVFHTGDAEENPLLESSMDFGYSLGVLHHIPNTPNALKACVEKLKPGAPFLLYLYYAFDNRPLWFRLIWKISDMIRRCISQMPHFLRYSMSQVIAVLIYYPLAKMSQYVEKIGVNVHNFPLSAYRTCSFYTMRTDALDRFGTSLEQRFSKKEIQSMMEKAGLERIHFSDKEPFWCAVGYRKKDMS